VPTLERHSREVTPMSQNRGPTGSAQNEAAMGVGGRKTLTSHWEQETEGLCQCQAWGKRWYDLVRKDAFVVQGLDFL
jgi:hypothetical protein